MLWWLGVDTSLLSELLAARPVNVDRWLTTVLDLAQVTILRDYSNNTDLQMSKTS